MSFLAEARFAFCDRFNRVRSVDGTIFNAEIGKLKFQQDELGNVYLPIEVKKSPKLHNS